MANNLPPTPLTSPIVEPKTGLMTRGFNNWLLTFITRVQAATFALVSLASPTAGFSAAIANTALVPVAAAGTYRISIYARVLTPASVNSSLIPTVTTTDGGIACAQSGDALVSNATNAPKSWHFIVKADPSTPISYAFAYVSNLAGMIYGFAIRLEQLS